MKQKLQNNCAWRAGALVVKLVFATYLLAQTQTPQVGGNPQSNVSPPDAQETADAARLIDAVNSGDTQGAVEILQTYGITGRTLQTITANLGKTPAILELEEPFLKTSMGVLARTDQLLKTNPQPHLTAAIAARGYQRPVWIPRPPEKRLLSSYDDDLLQCPQPPIFVVNQKLNDPCFIRFFKLYDRFADNVHSVVLNDAPLSNARLHSPGYAPASRQLNAFFQLIKARKPEAFVWLTIVKQDNRSDESWLKALTFRPDGLRILNLNQFHSPFAQTRQRYRALLGADRPMVVGNFHGYSAALKQQGDRLTTALREDDSQAAAAAAGQLEGIGAAGPDLAELETYLQLLGYRGLSANWLLLLATVNDTNAPAIDKSDLPDPRLGSLDSYSDQKDYAQVLTIATELISDSVPGDLDWTAGKLYQGIAWLSQSPPKTAQAIAVLDEVLAYNFTNRLGRDHYILGAVKWRLYAASLSDDKTKMQQLIQWVQDQPFPKGAQSALVRQFSSRLTPAQPSSK